MAQAREEELIDYPVIRYVSDKDSFVDDHKYTSMECYLDIDLNGKRFTTSFCSPGDHVDLVIGILAQMGQIAPTTTSSAWTSTRRTCRPRS